MTKPFGLYIHIPYCRALCHYCDFAKTANFAETQTRAFFRQLSTHLEDWIAYGVRTGLLTPAQGHHNTGLWTSVFFGGGTPSLFGEEYGPLMQLIRPWIAPAAEITLEANPDDVTSESLTSWRALGFNRLSMGVQTFADAGLKRLHRTHDGARAREAIVAALPHFSTLNVDLIYGWPGQTLTDWDRDLDQVLTLGVPHLSLYTLTFEGRTPLGRAAQRGVVAPVPDENLAQFYEHACARLKEAGYHHDEVSNWSQPGATCQHNWLYWQDGYFVGVGPGAHGYLPSSRPEGLRYAYPPSDRSFLRQKADLRVVEAGNGPDLDVTQVPLLNSIFGVKVESPPERDLESWLLEYVGSSLRTSLGVNLTLVEDRIGRPFRPKAVLSEALDRGWAVIKKERDGARSLVLIPAEWYREVSWSLAVIESFEAV